MPRVLLACEESQAVCIEMRKLGLEAYSCDILEPSGGHPEWHIQGDVLPVLEQDWDLVIAFPPCTHLTNSGARWFAEKRADGRQQVGIDFFMQIVNAPCERIAVENPVGIMSSIYRKPDQVIQPYWFGDPVSKKTCLWLKGLPPLERTHFDLQPEMITNGKGKTYDAWWYATCMLPIKDGQRAAARSKTFPGVAKQMAEQWSKLL